MYYIKKLNNISDRVNDILSPDRYTLSDNLESYDGVLVRSADMHDMALPKEAVAVARAGAGVNNIPLDSMSEAGVVVFNTPGANANAVKELVLCAMLLTGRNVIGGVEWVKEQNSAGVKGIDKLAEKEKNNFVGRELSGKTLGVIGLGAIGVMVANAACNGLGMEVLGYDPYMSIDAAFKLTRGVKHSTNIDDIFRECDFISLHIPLTEATKGMVGDAQLAMMKDGAVLLNFARGGLVDETAVLESLSSGKLYNYVTDFVNDNLAGKPGVIAIPHLGASTPESEENCAEMAAQQLKSYIEDGNIVNSVNFPSCEMSRSGGYRVAVINRNVANMVGQITAIIASTGNNIDHMINTSRGDWAYTLLELTHEPSADSIGKIASVNGVVRVRTLY